MSVLATRRSRTLTQSRASSVPKRPQTPRQRRLVNTKEQIPLTTLHGKQEKESRDSPPDVILICSVRATSLLILFVLEAHTSSRRAALVLLRIGLLDPSGHTQPCIPQVPRGCRSSDRRSTCCPGVRTLAVWGVSEGTVAGGAILSWCWSGRPSFSAYQFEEGSRIGLFRSPWRRLVSHRRLFRSL
jgi:hypothetical protein